jgi:hypothetical protein
MTQFENKLINNSKYSKKIEAHIQNIEAEINICFDDYKTFEKNTSIQNIFYASEKARQTDNICRLIDGSTLTPLHNKDQYPLSYIFFRILKEMDLLDNIITHTPDLSDLHTFMDWYRENISAINFDDIHKLMENLPLKQRALSEEVPLKQRDKVPNKIDENEDEDDNENYKILYDSLITIYSLMFKVSNHRKILHDAIYDNKFISIDVQYDIESSTLEYYKYLINNKHHINVFVPKGTEPPDMKVVAMIISTMENLKNDTVPKSIYLTIIFSNQKKIVDPRTKILSYDNINSGSTYPGKTITCWRREEFYKVLIHELIHYHNFDFFPTNNYYEELESRLQIPKIEGSDALNESYTETLAIIILSVIHYTNDLYKNKIDETNNEITNRMEYMKHFIKKELSFIMFQVAKILVIFGSNSFDDYANNEIIINQNTSFRSYFIIKMLLLSNLDDTIALINENLIIQDKKILEFGDLINQSWKKFLSDPKMINTMNELIEDVKNAFSSNNKKWIYKTCRMSVNDIIEL